MASDDAQRGHVSQGDVDVTLGVTAHREGYLLHRTMRAARRLVATATAAGMVVEIVVNLDRADDRTRGFAAAHAEQDPSIRLQDSDFGDVASARNGVVDAARGRYVCLMDGDDLLTDTFLVDAFGIAEAYGRHCIVFPDLVFTFGQSLDRTIHRQRSTLETPEMRAALFEYNTYVCTFLASREIYAQCRYEPSVGLYGFEDWHWVTQAAAAGFEFIRCPESAFFYRLKSEEESLRLRHATTNTVLRPSPLFAPGLFGGLPTRPYDHAPAGVPSWTHRVRGIAQEFVDVVYRATPAEARRPVGQAVRLSRRVRERLINAQWLGAEALEVESVPERPLNGPRPYLPTTSELLRWNRLNDIEPVIRFDEEILPHLSVYEYTFHHAATTAYHRLCQRFGECGITDLIIIPWLVRGGADLAIVDLVEQLAARGRRVAILTTLGLESSWRSRVEPLPGVTFLESHRFPFHDLDAFGLKMVLMRLIQNWGVQTLTVMNSSIGFEMIRRYGPAIRAAGCRVVTHKYAFPLSGDLLIEPFADMASSIPYLDRVIVDSQLHRGQLQTIYAMESERITVVPLQETSGIAPRRPGVSHRVLFANRLAHEKQPDVAIAAVEQLGGLTRLELRGPIDEGYAERIGLAKVVDDAEHASYLGPFEGSASLSWDDYDVCLLTSLYEGVPRIVLDAAAANTFVICPAVGGLPEVVTHGRNGLLVAPESPPEVYAEALRTFYSSPELQDEGARWEHNRALLQSRAQPTYAELISDAYALDAAR